MFSPSEIKTVLLRSDFQDDFHSVQQSLAETRLRQTELFLNGSRNRLSYFVETVLASAPKWDVEESYNVSRIAGEIAETLAMSMDSDIGQKKMRLRAALLYELADLPALSQSVIKGDMHSGILSDLFARAGAFGQLIGNDSPLDLVAKADNSKPSAETVVSADAMALAEYQQGIRHQLPPNQCAVLRDVATWVSLDLSASELAAFDSILKRRASRSTKANVNDVLFQDLRTINFPPELWPTQVKALQNGLLDSTIDSWGLAAPTGTGKTFLCRALILNNLTEKPDTTVLYLVPSRALVSEVSSSLTTAFQNTDFKVAPVTAQLVALSDVESGELGEISVAVLTPEKADLLLRVGADFIKRASLIIVDEAHLIEADTRGVLLELYLWRLRRILSDATRVVFLSAVAPNILELASSMGRRPKAVASAQRATRMRVGVYRIKGSGKAREGWLEYSDGVAIRILEGKIETQKRRGLVQLADSLGRAGPVLVVAKGKGECEALAREMTKWLKEQNRLNTLSLKQLDGEHFQRLDSRLEREMYPAIEMREFLTHRIAYHHAGLPPRVRHSVEEAIRKGLVDYVFATTTLAEGVNFPFSSVIVQSLALREPPERGRPSRYRIVTPRTFWNIAGRAGRPGFDKEGQAVLYEPSLGLDKVNAVLEKYLDPSMGNIDPVNSALAQGLKEISASIQRGDFSQEDLIKEVLPPNVPKRVHGSINLIRVGLVHAKASGILSSPEEILEGTLASHQLTEEQKISAKLLVTAQAHVVDSFLAKPNAPPVEFISELGISIETLSLLREYVSSLTDWQIRQFENLFFGGRLNLEAARFVIGPVAKRMAELEGPALGGIYSEVILNWLAGIPLHVVRSQSQRLGNWESLEDLISVIYSRIQYLLPWGLYAMNRIVEEEARRRNIPYENKIGDLAYLADAGVPSFDALRLVSLEFERVDATRLSEFYHHQGSRDLGTDIIGWLRTVSKETIESCLKGNDSRRIDYDLPTLVARVRGVQP